MGALIGGGTLDFGQPVHDYAQASSSGHACCVFLTRHPVYNLVRSIHHGSTANFHQWPACFCREECSPVHSTLDLSLLIYLGLVRALH